jgi:hypothetical protein
VRRRTLALIGVVLVLICVIVAQNLGLIPVYRSNDVDGNNPINVGAAQVQFSDWELQAWNRVKNRVVVYNADPEFAGNRVLQWISMRNSTSASWDNYHQKSMEFLCFWEGQGTNGEWQAVVSIYNSPNSTSDFVVEVPRFIWHWIQVKLDCVVKVDFPQVTDDTVSLGYCTFHVSV